VIYITIFLFCISGFFEYFVFTLTLIHCTIYFKCLFKFFFFIFYLSDTLKTVSTIESDNELVLAVTKAIFEDPNPGLDTALVQCLKKIGKFK